MKLMSLRFLAVTSFALAVLLASCSKEGPAGAQGATGATGPAGPAGSQGPKGDTGVANVIYSAWLDIAYKPDTIMVGTVVTDTIGWYSNIAAAKLTNAILTTGMVNVYVNLNTAAQPFITLVPYFDPSSGLSIQHFDYLNTIQLYSNGNVGTFSIGANKYQQYRYVLVPGGVLGGRAANVNWKSYESVKKAFNIPD